MPALILALLLCVSASIVSNQSSASAPDEDAYTVPSSIDNSGASDASTALQQFVNGVPNGSTISFRSGTYRMAHGLRLTNRRDLVFDGNGATLQATGSGSEAGDSLFVLATGNTGITIREFTLVGNNPDAGTADAFHGGVEHQMGVLVWNGTDIDIHDVAIRGTWGDCVYIGTNSAGTWSDTVRFHDSTCSLSGRSALSIIAARHVTIERVRFDRIGMSIVNMEPNTSSNGAVDVMIRDNTIGSYGLNNEYTSWVLAAVGASGADMRDVSLVDNTISGVARAGTNGLPRGLHVRIEDRGTRQDFVIRGNTSTRTVAGPSMLLTGIDGLTVTGNVQPLSSGSLARCTDCTGVIEGGNRTGACPLLIWLIPLGTLDSRVVAPACWFGNLVAAILEHIRTRAPQTGQGTLVG